MVETEGPANLLGLESGSPASHEDYRSNGRKLFNGRLLTDIQSQQIAGVVKIIISVPGLQPKVISYS